MDVDPALREFLAGTPFFGGLAGTPIFDKVIAMLRPRSVKKGEMVLREGDTATSMYIVRSGVLLAYRHCEDGGIARMLLFRPGDFVGVTTLVEMEPRPFSIITECDAELLELDSRDLYWLYKDDMKAYVLVLQNINRELVRRLRKAGNRIAVLSRKLGPEATEPGPEHHHH
ncbi:MAG: Crp/Fnr family transcriptional regulator [Myxococcales bacterium]